VEFDIVIIGGGLVGATLANALSQQPLRIGIIDKVPYPLNNDPEGDARALALSETSVRCLTILNVWPRVMERACPIAEIHVSKYQSFGITRLCARDYQLPTFGYVVNAEVLNGALNNCLEAATNIQIFRPDEVVKLIRLDQGWQLDLRSQKSLTTTLLVAADGGDSYLRKHQGIHAKIIDHHQSAMVVNLELAKPHCNVAYERFTDNGSLAILPLTGNRVKCVWIFPEALVKNFQAMPEAEFLDKLQKHFGKNLGSFIRLGQRLHYPLRTILSETIYGDRLVLIGNAANTLHPVAAQGFNLGLRDAAMLAEIVVSARRRNHDIASVEVLRAYASRRQTDYKMIRQFTHHLVETHFLQGFGILACTWVPPFKKRIVARALGRQGELPKLCRGVSLIGESLAKHEVQSFNV